MKYSLVLFAAVGLLASCGTVEDIVYPDDRPLNDSAKAWLQQQNGQLLTFQNAAGATQLVRVGRRLETAAVPADKLSPATINVEFATLAYSLFPAKVDSFGVVAYNGNTLEFRPQVNAPGDTRPGTNNMAGDLLTNDDPRQERSVRDSTDLRRTLVLGGRTYSRLMVVDGLSYNKLQPAPSAFEEVYYTRNEGLVGFKTRGGELWLRP